MSEHEIRDVLHQLFVEAKQPEKLLEIFYWAQEEGIEKYLRNFFCLKPDIREALKAAIECGPEQVDAEWDVSGRLVLGSSNRLQSSQGNCGLRSASALDGLFAVTGESC